MNTHLGIWETLWGFGVGGLAIGAGVLGFMGAFVPRYYHRVKWGVRRPSEIPVGRLSSFGAGLFFFSLGVCLPLSVVSTSSYLPLVVIPIMVGWTSAVIAAERDKKTYLNKEPIQPPVP